MTTLTKEELEKLVAVKTAMTENLLTKGDAK